MKGRCWFFAFNDDVGAGSATIKMYLEKSIKIDLEKAIEIYLEKSPKKLEKNQFALFFFSKKNEIKIYVS